MEGVDRFPIQRITAEGSQDIEDTVVRELPLTITLNGHDIATLLCSPQNLDCLAVGFLVSEGLLDGKDDIKNIIVDEGKGSVRVETASDIQPPDSPSRGMITSGCGRGVSFCAAVDDLGQPKIDSRVTISSDAVFALAREFQSRSRLFEETGGVHSAALCGGEEILLFHEDIGRHNAIDKIFGECLLNDISLADRVIVTSGRVSSEIVLKIVNRKIPILISRSAPTDLGVRLADALGVTLIGFVRGKRMNVYANGWRVTTSG